MVALRFDDGATLNLDHRRWHAEPDDTELGLLERLPAPVLDVGCGPGRIVAALARRGVPALGVDPSAAAAALARQRGAAVLQRSVFDRLPGKGRWGAVLLFDGNVGIGGDAVRLLRRCRQLIRPDGAVLAEIAAPGSGWRTRQARIERDGLCSPWFPWTTVSVDAIGDVAWRAALRVTWLECRDQRWFASLAHLDAHT